MMIKSSHYTFITLIRVCVFPLKQLLIGRLKFIFEEYNCTCSLSGREGVSSDWGRERERGEKEEEGSDEEENTEKERFTEEEEEAGVGSLSGPAPNEHQSMKATRCRRTEGAVLQSPPLQSLHPPPPASCTTSFLLWGWAANQKHRSKWKEDKEKQQRRKSTEIQSVRWQQLCFVMLS